MTTSQQSLHLTVNRFWFDKIATGVKTTDYRTINQYWYSRLFDHIDQKKNFKKVVFRNGYKPNSPKIEAEFIGVRWISSETIIKYSDGTTLIPGPCYAIDIGRILKIENWQNPRQHKIPIQPIHLNKNQQ